MIFTVFDIIMAPSLRSVAGVLYGEYRKFCLGEEHYYNYSDIYIFKYLLQRYRLFVAKIIKW